MVTPVMLSAVVPLLRNVNVFDEVLPLAQPARLVGLTLSALEEDEPDRPTAIARPAQGTLPF